MLKKIFKLFFGRFLWIGLILLIEVALAIFFIIFGANILELIAAVIAVLISREPNLDVIESVLDFSVMLILFVFDFILMTYIVNSKANTSYKITWLFVVGLLPVIGGILYLMFGNKNTTKRMKRKLQPIHDATKHFKIEQDVHDALNKNEKDLSALNLANYIVKECGTNLTKNTEVTYFKSGEDAWPHMLHELLKAKHYIFLEYFIIERGLFWNSIVDILAQKVQEGVDVRVMYDDVGSIQTIPTFYPRKLRKMGIKCVAYNRFKPFVNVKLNNRDHRKILVIDGKVGFTGGINLADEYVNKKVRFGYWKDNSIMLKGESVHNLTQLFLANWVNVNKTGFDELSDPKYEAFAYKDESEKINPSGYVQPYGDIPYDDEAVGERVYIQLINKAQHYVYITTPYLIIDDEMTNALCNAAKSGVNVVLLTPHIPDKKMVFNVTRSYYDPLLEAGVKIYEFTPGFVHEKMFIVDDIFGTVGTINLDYRSLYLHLENGVFLYKCDCLKDMKKDYEESIASSEEITLEKYQKLRRGKKVLWSLLRVFAPLM